MVDSHVRWQYIRSTVNSQTDSTCGFPNVCWVYHFVIKIKLEGSGKVDLSQALLVITSIFWCVFAYKLIYINT